MATSGVESRQGVMLTLLLLQDMEISVFELRTILNRVISRRKHYRSYPLLPAAQVGFWCMCSTSSFLLRQRSENRWVQPGLLPQHGQPDGCILLVLWARAGFHSA